MQKTTLGRTDLEVSVAGLGCGGRSRLGATTGSSFEQSVDLVRSAVDLGITYIDTAERYGTEPIVGAALRGRREGVVVSTKVTPENRDGQWIGPAGLRDQVGRSLRALQTDTIDVFHLHAVLPGMYPRCRDELVPELLSLRDRGLIRFLALSERFDQDTRHDMVVQALPDECWDVVMVGFNLLNPSARTRVIPLAERYGVGVEVMYAVRHALSDPDALRRIANRLVDTGQVRPSEIDRGDPLGFLVHQGGATSVVDAAYRFARHEPGTHVVLTGTGDLDHLRRNVRSLEDAPLPAADMARLQDLFGHVDDLTGD